MMTCSGISVLEGIAIGKLHIFEKKQVLPEDTYSDDPDRECVRFELAAAEAQKQLQELFDTSIEQNGKEYARIFEVHRLILEDEEYLKAVETRIRQQNMNAVHAVQEAGVYFAKLLEKTEDEYVLERAADILDVTERLIGELLGIRKQRINPEEPAILIADDLSPSETVLLDREKILAIVTRKGTVNSHTAILARSMNIPALVQTDVEISKIKQNVPAVVDGISGQLIIEPDSETLQKMTGQKMAIEKEKDELQQLIGKENITLDGRKIRVYANIGDPMETQQVLEADAGGIGLFRSEFFYLGRTDYPSEEELFQNYKEVLTRMNGKRVIIRTIDIGADKQAAYFGLPQEENPALGFRAIRICLERRDLFKTQLRAILRASVYGQTAVMFPMIISVEEIRKARQILEEVKEELRQIGTAFCDIEVGIMVETPAAVMLSDELANEVDFFSIGTNDLTQYTLAADRQNPNLGYVYDTHHPAVLRMIRKTVDNGHRNGIRVGICGELASDLTMTEKLIAMGVDELSVSPSHVLKLRKKIREIKDTSFFREDVLKYE